MLILKKLDINRIRHYMYINMSKLKKILLWITIFLLGIGLMFVLWTFIIDPYLSRTEVGILTSSKIDTSDYATFLPREPDFELGHQFDPEVINQAYLDGTLESLELEGDYYFQYFQPIVKEYKEENGLQVMVAEYGDPITPGVRRNVKIILGGDIVEPSILEQNPVAAQEFAERFSDSVVYLTLENMGYLDNPENFMTNVFTEEYPSLAVISIDEFKAYAPVGTQVSLVYMVSHIPSEQLTKEVCEGYEVHCGLVEISAEYDFPETDKLYNGGQVSSEFYLLPYFFTSILIDE